MKRSREEKAKSGTAGVRFGAWQARAGLALLAIVLYAGAIGHDLAQDSRAVVGGDTRIRTVSAENLKLILTKDYWWPNAVDRLYRPVTTASLMVNYALLGNGQNAAGYRAVNVLLHAANAILVFELAWLLLGAVAPAFFAAAVWAAHPAGVECVTQIVGRADAMAVCAVLGGLLLYLRGRTRERRAVWIAGLFAAALLGVFAKELAAVLVGMMLLWDLSFPRPAAWAKLAPWYAAAAAPLGLLLVARAAVFRDAPYPQLPYLDNVLRGADFFTARLTAVKVLGFDLLLMAFPARLSIDRSYGEILLAGVADPLAWLSLAAIAGIVGWAVAMRARQPLIFFLAGFCGIALLPTSNLLLLVGTIMGERFLYLPMVALAIAIAAAAQARVASARARALVLAALVLLYGGRTLARNADWRDDLTLASADVVSAPASARLHDMLAKTLYERDERANLDRAIREQEAAWEILKPLPPERSSELIPAHLGIYYFVKAGAAGRASEAGRAWYARAVEALEQASRISRVGEKAFDAAQLAHGKPLTRRPAFQLLYFYLAYARQNLGRDAEALEALRYARGLNPSFVESYDGMAGVYAARGEAQPAAIALLEKTLVEGPQPQTLAGLRVLYGRIPEGGCALRGEGAALRLDPACPKLRADACAAAAELRAAYAEARMADRGAEVEREAAHTYACGR
jgi:tetratricopeptide (TPR) repeat protein